MNTLGVNVVETPGRASPSVGAAPTSVTGFIVLASRSSASAVEVTSWSGYLKSFGYPRQGELGAYAVKGFFDNGGAVARIVSVLAASADEISAYSAAAAKAAAAANIARAEADRAPTDTALAEAASAAEAAASSAALRAEEPNLDGFGAALALLELTAVQLVVIPDSSHAAVTKLALAHCESMGDRMFIGHTPKAATTGVEAARATSSLTGANVYGAVYFPWIEVASVVDPSKPKDPAALSTVEVPPSGHIAGVYARTDVERGVWKAPAGNAANLRGALNVTAHLNDVEHTLLVKEGRVNAVRALPGRGIVIDSARTLSTDDAWTYVNARLLMNFVKSSLKASLSWVKYEPNDRALWNRLKHNTITPFLMGLWRRGAFGSGEPTDLFTVVIDETNNSPEDIKQGLLNASVTFYPSRPAETIVISIGQQDAGTTITEA